MSTLMSELITTPTPTRTPRPFDFRHPSTLSRDDARTLQVLQETIAHGVATTFATAVRASIDVQIRDIEQVPYGEVVRQTPNPSPLVLLRIDPISSVALLHVDAVLSFALIELLLGGSGNGPHPDRAHSEVEETLLGGLIEGLRPSMDEAFEPLAPVTTSILGHESNPTYVQIASATDMVVSIVLDIGVDDIRGTMRLVVPIVALQPHLDELSANAAESPRNPEERAIIGELVASELSWVDVEAVARFDPVIAASRDLADLAVGDVFTLDHSIETPLIMEIGGVAVHDIALGRVKRHLAAEVLGPAPLRPRRAHRLTRVNSAVSSDSPDS